MIHYTFTFCRTHIVSSFVDISCSSRIFQQDSIFTSYARRASLSSLKFFLFFHSSFAEVDFQSHGKYNVCEAKIFFVNKRPWNEIAFHLFPVPHCWKLIFSHFFFEKVSLLHTARFISFFGLFRPLPKSLFLPSPSDRFYHIQCRNSLSSLAAFLKQWSSFVLSENHTYIKFIDG